MTEVDKEKYFKLKDKYDAFRWIVMMFTPYVNIPCNGKIPT